METKQETISGLFGSAVRYEIPESQREYVWDVDRQWRPLWDDVRDTALAYLQRTEQPVTAGRKIHFMGPVVVQDKDDPDHLGGTVSTKAVWDGQQRLTTLQLFLNAVREVAKHHKSQTAEMLAPYVMNMPASWPGQNQEYQFKVWSKASEKDRVAFSRAMGWDWTRSDWITGSEANELIMRAHGYFVTSIEGWLSSDLNNISAQQKLEALQHTLLDLIMVVVIDVGQDDDPKQIYQILNSRGTSLSQADLIRSHVIEEGASSTTWPLSGDWWNERVNEDRLERNRAEVLLHHWVTMRGRRTVQPHDLYSGFKQYLSRNSVMSLSTILQDIDNTAGQFCNLTDKVSPLNFFLIDFASQDIVPAVLWLLINEKNPVQQTKALAAIASFVARRRISNESTGGEQFKRIVQQLLADVMTDENIGKSGNRTVGWLKRMAERSPSAWPDDAVLEDNLRRGPIYQKVGGPATVRTILRALDLRMRLERPNGGGTAPSFPPEGIKHCRTYHADSMGRALAHQRVGN